MCMSCGCGEYTDDHGNPDNITLTDLVAAAQAGGVGGIEETADNIHFAANAVIAHEDPVEDNDEDDGEQDEFQNAHDQYYSSHS